MGRYTKYSTKVQMRDRPWSIHPIWRGIGCFLVIIIPVISYAAAVLLVDANLKQNWVPAPLEVMVPVRIPLINITVEHLYANVLTTFAIMLVGYAGVMIVYAIAYRVIGPPFLSPLDAPPVRQSPKARRRIK